MLELNYDFASCVRNSEKVCWKVDEVLPAETKLDFSRPFLPDALCGASRLDFLDAAEKLKLNHINGDAYINLFVFVEEYIIVMALQHANAEMFGDHDAIRALARFAEEEVKHQQLFWRYLKLFEQGFGHPCDVLG